jgi:hypothetical protein
VKSGPIRKQSNRVQAPTGQLPGKSSPHNRSRFEWTTPLRSQAEPNTISGWAAAIKQTWACGPANILELARLIAQARKALQYGEWSQLWRANRLPFSKRKGEMLRAIGTNLNKLDVQNSAHLPTAWNTLYYLARLGLSTVEQLIRKGRIHPGSSLKEAKALVAEFRIGKPHKNSRPAVIIRLNRFSAFIRATLPAWSQRERRLAKDELLDLLEKISSVENPPYKPEP